MFRSTLALVVLASAPACSAPAHNQTPPAGAAAAKPATPSPAKSDVSVQSAGATAPKPVPPTAEPTPTPAAPAVAEQADAPRAGDLGTGPFVARKLAGPLADDKAVCAELRIATGFDASLPEDAFECRLAAIQTLGDVEVRGLQAGVPRPFGEGLTVGFAVRNDAGWFIGYSLADLGGSVHGDTSSKASGPVFSAVTIAGKPGLQIDLAGTDERGGKPQLEVSVRASCALGPTAVACSPAVVTSMKGVGSHAKIAFTASTALSPTGELEVRADGPVPDIDMFHFPRPAVGKLTLLPS